jgi:hypothetical protein
MDEQQKKWKPDPSKFADNWRKMWFEILDGRRFSIRQTHGEEAAKKYRPHSAEENYFKQWGKLPAHVTSEDAEVPYADALRAMEMVNAHHDRYWAQMTKEYPDRVKAFWKRLSDQLAEVQATPAYQISQQDRKELIEYSEAIVAKMRNLGSNDKEAQHPAGQQVEQAIADQTKTAPKAEQGQDANEAAQ